MYLGGNGICGAVEFPDEGTIRHLNHIGDGGHPERGTARFAQHAESPARLLGVAFDDRGIMTAAPYRVVDPDHWAFAGTGLAEGDLFGSESQQERIHGGASGHETDKISSEAPEGTQLLAQGINPNDGGADMVYLPDRLGRARLFDRLDHLCGLAAGRRTTVAGNHECARQVRRVRDRVQTGIRRGPYL